MVLTALPRDFYRGETVRVARELLGRELVCRDREGETTGIIVETEAYLGVKDAASHAFGGRRTPRTEVLFGEAGRAYVYLIYGLHCCLNLTAGPPGGAECVLIRALEPRAGRERMVRRRASKRERDLTNGPGKLCQALGIDRRLNGEELSGGRLFLREGRDVREEEVEVAQRIGIDYAGEARGWPLRFYLKESLWVSRK